MEHEMDAYLNEWEPDTWTPWEADADMLDDILTSQLIPPVDESAPDWYSEALSNLSNTASTERIAA